MMRDEIIAVARTYLGTPHHHQGRALGAGVDCIGLVICVCRELGFLPPTFDRLGYGQSPRAAEVLAGLREHLIEIPVSEAQPGDVLVLAAQGTGEAVHVGFKTDVGLLHSYASRGQVVEHGLRGPFATAVRHAFRVPGVAHG